MTHKQFRALKAIFIILDALIENVQEAIHVLDVAIFLLKISNTVPEYEVVNIFLDAMEKKYSQRSDTMYKVIDTYEGFEDLIGTFDTFDEARAAARQH